MKAPGFWRINGWQARLLLPVSALWAGAGRLRFACVTPLRFPVPVICIGNLTAGGGGKTPLALWVGEWCKARGIQAFFISRGYGGTLSGPAQVSPAHTACDVGDEPLLLARCLPTVIGRSRRQAAQLALSLGAQAIIMDDGFQNPSLHKNLNLVAIDSGFGFGNGLVMPAGPLRELLAQGLKRADALVLIGEGRLPILPENLPAVQAYIEPQGDTADLQGRRLFAFCGIARPGKFYDSLHKLGAQLAGTQDFPDHYPYTHEDAQALIERAQALNALPVTTAKDAVRLPPTIREAVYVLNVALRFDNPQAIDTLLEKALIHAKPQT